MRRREIRLFPFELWAIAALAFALGFLWGHIL
jgi:hypothetical protein